MNLTDFLHARLLHMILTEWRRIFDLNLKKFERRTFTRYIHMLSWSRFINSWVINESDWTIRCQYVYFQVNINNPISEIYWCEMSHRWKLIIAEINHLCNSWYQYADTITISTDSWFSLCMIVLWSFFISLSLEDTMGNLFNGTDFRKSNIVHISLWFVIINYHYHYHISSDNLERWLTMSGDTRDHPSSENRRSVTLCKKRQ